MDWRHQELLTEVHNSASLDRVPQCLATFQGDHEHALSTGDSYGRALVHIAVGSGGAECSQIITFLAKVGCDIMIATTFGTPLHSCPAYIGICMAW